MGLEQYIAKVWLQKPMSMPEIAAALNLQKIELRPADERVHGIVRDGQLEREWVIKLSWGTWDRAEKIKVFCIPPMLTSAAVLAEEHIRQTLQADPHSSDWGRLKRVED